MIKVPSFKNLKILVLGLGLHGGGLHLSNWLIKQGARVTISDLKSLKELKPSLKKLVKSTKVKLVLGSHPRYLLRDCDLLIQNPAVPKTAPIIKAAKRLGITIENEASLFVKICPSRFMVGVTGSKGKSTTVNLLGQIFKASWPYSFAAGNIRDTVLFEILKKIKPVSRLVLELSSWQLEVMDLHSQRLPISVVTNILPDHLNRYKSLADYAKAKGSIVRWQTTKDRAVFNYDNDRTRRLAKLTKAKVYWFSTRSLVSRGCYIDRGWLIWRDKKNTRLIKVSDLKLTGDHNLSNILAATTAACLIGAPFNKIKKVLKNYSGLHDRLELVASYKERKFYNDTAATAPVATVAGLKVFSGQPLALIVGGQDKNLSYVDLARQILLSQAVVVMLPGTATDKLIKELPVDYSYMLADSMEQAVSLADQLLIGPGVVLLSPGAASFGLFKHEFDRGRQFKLAVKKLIKLKKKR